jgi:uncharacterized membrane protein
VSTQSRTLAILSYVIPLAGPAAALATRRDEPFTRYHAAQGLAIDLAALGVPLAWLVLGWVLAWVPTAGALLGVVLFGLVLAIEIVLLVGRALGMSWVLRDQMRAAPIVGGWAERAVLAREPSGPLSPVSAPVLEATAEQAPTAEASSPK